MSSEAASSEPNKSSSSKSGIATQSPSSTPASEAPVRSRSSAPVSSGRVRLPQAAPPEQTVGGRGESAVASPEQKPSLFAIYWLKIGGSSLLLSILVHVALLIGAALLVKTTLLDEKPVDFLPGGGSKAGRDATDALARNVQVKRQRSMDQSRSLSKVMSSGESAIKLTDIPLDAGKLPDLGELMGGGPMGAAGFGTAGLGGGIGPGVGLGGNRGITFKPIVMFGKDLKARKIAVVLDISGSMTQHLTAVIRELDRVAPGSRVILYVGCGISPPVEGLELDRVAVRTSSKSRQDEKSFEIFWRRTHGQNSASNMTPEAERDPIPEKEVYHMLAGRPETYFMQSQSVRYAWIALLAREAEDAEAIYWFADFQDYIEKEQINVVLDNLKRRRQRMFMHPLGKGTFLDKVRDMLVIPSGGDVIDSEPPR